MPLFFLHYVEAHIYIYIYILGCIVYNDTYSCLDSPWPDERTKFGCIYNWLDFQLPMIRITAVLAANQSHVAKTTRTKMRIALIIRKRIIMQLVMMQWKTFISYLIMMMIKVLSVDLSPKRRDESETAFLERTCEWCAQIQQQQQQPQHQQQQGTDTVDRYFIYMYIVVCIYSCSVLYLTFVSHSALAREMFHSMYPSLYYIFDSFYLSLTLSLSLSLSIYLSIYC